MKKSIRTILVAAAALGLTVVGAQTASAATLYDNQNYGGGSYAATTAPNVGALNDKASSLTNSGTRTYYEDAGYLGRKIALTGNVNSLQAYSTNLHFGETWNDRISSFN